MRHVLGDGSRGESPLSAATDPMKQASEIRVASLVRSDQWWLARHGEHHGKELEVDGVFGGENRGGPWQQVDGVFGGELVACRRERRWKFWILEKKRARD